MQSPQIDDKEVDIFKQDLVSQGESHHAQDQNIRQL